MTPSAGPRAARLLVLACVAIGGQLGCGGDDEADGPRPPANADEAKAGKYGLTPEQAAKTLARVGDTVITVGDFAERLGSQSPYLRARYASPERRREFLDNMIRFELLAIEANKEGLGDSEPVQRVRKQMMVQRMMTELFEDRGIKLADITENEIKAYYDAHREEFQKPAQVRASHILVQREALAKKLLTQLQAGPRDMQMFRELAKQHNIDRETKGRLGDLRFFGEQASDDPAEPKVPAALRKAAFTLKKVGDLYPEVIGTEAGFHVLRLTGKRAALDRSLDDARRLIQNRLWRDKRQEAIDAFVEDLRNKAHIVEDLTLLEKVDTNRAPAEPAAAAGPDGGAAKTAADAAAEPKE